MKDWGVVQIGDKIKRHRGVMVQYIVCHFFKYGWRRKRCTEKNGAIRTDFALFLQLPCTKRGNQTQAAEAAGIYTALLL